MIKCILNLEQIILLFIGFILIILNNITIKHLYITILGWIIVFIGLIKYKFELNIQVILTFCAILMILSDNLNNSEKFSHSYLHILGFLVLGFSIGINSDNSLDYSDIVWGLFGSIVVLLSSNYRQNIELVVYIIGILIISLFASCNEKD
jgi:hypothetical protein